MKSTTTALTTVWAKNVYLFTRYNYDNSLTTVKRFQPKCSSSLTASCFKLALNKY